MRDADTGDTAYAAREALTTYIRTYMLVPVMAQIALYIEDTLEQKLTMAARKAGQSKSAWVKAAIQDKVAARLPEDWFALWGSWEDPQSPERLLKTIRRGTRERTRARLK